MSLICLNLYINEKFISSEKVDSRIPLAEYRSIKQLSDSMFFLYDRTTILVDEEMDIMLNDILQNSNEIKLIDTNVETDITDPIMSNKITFPHKYSVNNDYNVIHEINENPQSRCRRTRSTTCIQEGINY
jgi:hypothetical protein